MWAVEVPRLGSATKPMFVAVLCIFLLSLTLSFRCANQQQSDGIRPGPAVGIL